MHLFLPGCFLGVRAAVGRCCLGSLFGAHDIPEDDLRSSYPIQKVAIRPSHGPVTGHRQGQPLTSPCVLAFLAEGPGGTQSKHGARLQSEAVCDLLWPRVSTASTTSCRSPRVAERGKHVPVWVCMCTPMGGCVLGAA